MSPNSSPTPVVVDIDDRATAEDALDWAPAEAEARGCPLRVVHAFQPPVPADPYGVASRESGIPLSGSRPRSWCLTSGSGRWFVLVDQSAEDWSAPDPAASWLGNRHLRAWWTQSQRSMRPPRVVVRSVGREHSA